MAEILSLLKEWPVQFIGSGTFSVIALRFVWYFLQRQERELDSTRKRVDHWGDECYARWQKSEFYLSTLKDRYLDLWHDAPDEVQAKHPHLHEIEKTMRDAGIHE